MPRSDTTPPPTPRETQAYWSPRLRGGATVIAGTLAYGALDGAFGGAGGFGTAVVGMLGSLGMMGVVWWLERRRAEKAAARPD
ncbi:MAG: hypothetical protein IT355_06440 [Gemmatimonadaceae bacterium]|nr:hypothetical protein [Gemmatimonadaceae bacterium]